MTWSMHWLSYEDVRHTFHLRHEEMIPTLHDMMVLFGLPIDGRLVTSTDVYNRIMLCEWSFGLILTPSKFKWGSIRLKWIDETFTTPWDDINDKVLWGYKLNYNLNDILMCSLFVKFEWVIMIILICYVDMLEYIYCICLAVYYLQTS
jgi:hypothetical protein